jgi:hypothetical protein
VRTQHLDPRSYRVRARTAVAGGGVTPPRTGVEREGFTRGGSVVEVGSVARVREQLSSLGLWSTELERTRKARVAAKSKEALLRGREAAIGARKEQAEELAAARYASRVAAKEMQHRSWLQRVMDSDITEVQKRKGPMVVRPFKGLRHATLAPTALVYKVHTFLALLALLSLQHLAVIIERTFLRTASPRRPRACSTAPQRAPSSLSRSRRWAPPRERRARSALPRRRGARRASCNMVGRKVR